MHVLIKSVHGTQLNTPCCKYISIPRYSILTSWAKLKSYNIEITVATLDFYANRFSIDYA